MFSGGAKQRMEPGSSNKRFGARLRATCPLGRNLRQPAFNEFVGHPVLGFQDRDCVRHRGLLPCAGLGNEVGVVADDLDFPQMAEPNTEFFFWSTDVVVLA